MERLRTTMIVGAVFFALAQDPQVAAAQGKGGGKGQGGGQVDKDRGGPSGKIKEKPSSQGRAKENRDVTKQNKGVAKGNKAVAKGNKGVAKGPGRAGLVAAAAVSHAGSRGNKGDVRFIDSDDGVRIVNRKGERLLVLDEDDARDLGRWRVGVVRDEVRGGAPSFCRSGEGHPVWGRDWCIDKGFGLGSYRDFRWGRTDDLGDIVFRPDRYDRSLLGDALAGLIGSRAYNRLALHAVTLGLVEPLVGRWVAQDTGPRMLIVDSGGYPVAEFVDVNRDNRPDNLLVALLTQ